MNRSLGNPALKRRRPGSGTSGLVEAENAVLNAIRSRKDLGIWLKDIKEEAKLPDPVFNRCLKALLDRQLIKEVVNIKFKAKKHYMAVEFDPSKEISGGDWYENGVLDQELIEALKNYCVKLIRHEKVATVEGVHLEVKNRRLVTFDITCQQVKELLDYMVLDDKVIEVKSTGLGEYHSIPVGTLCYRAATETEVSKATRPGAFASIPCGACPRISLCRPDGVISPSTCVYYAKWLGVEF